MTSSVAIPVDVVPVVVDKLDCTTNKGAYVYPVCVLPGVLVYFPSCFPYNGLWEVVQNSVLEVDNGSVLWHY